MFSFFKFGQVHHPAGLAESSFSPDGFYWHSKPWEILERGGGGVDGDTEAVSALCYVLSQIDPTCCCLFFNLLHKLTV